MVCQAFVSSRIVTPQAVRPGTVLVKNGKIQSVEIERRVPGGYEALDFGDDCILPGLVDTHVHLNDPGRSDWEGFRTGTQAAAAGGITTVVDMPLNCLPETTTVEALAAKRIAAVGEVWIDWMSWGGLVEDNCNQIEPLIQAGVPGFKCFLVPSGVDGFSMVREKQLRCALPYIASAGLPLLVHAELDGPVEAATTRLKSADWTLYSTYLKSRPDQAETDAIAMMISLCREFQARIHIVHLSSAAALEMLNAARMEGLPITVESCPHYLHFIAEDVTAGNTLLKCAPPIRSLNNRERLWEGLRKGTIDLVASDHSPCPPSLKRLNDRNFQSAWGGIASLSLSLSVLWTSADARNFSLCDVAKWMAEKPAALAGMDGRKGKIAHGYDADLVVFDPETSWTVTTEDLYYRHRISAYLGKSLRGKVKQTFVRGNLVFADGEFCISPIGKELRA